MISKFICSRCKFKVDEHPAISRRDNKTEICSSCGVEEALFDFKINKEKWEEKKWMN